MAKDAKKLIKGLQAEKEVSAPKTIDDVKKLIKQSGTPDDPIIVLNNARNELNSRKIGKPIEPGSNLYKAFTLFEFDKGMLMSSAIPERYRTFCIDFSQKLQKEYHCETPSEKATAELVTINFVRTLEIQCRINWRLEKGEFGEIGVKYLAILSKELDRANRHYLNSLQTLKMLKQPMLEVNIKTQTAIVGQNQVVQSNNK